MDDCLEWERFGEWTVVWNGNDKLEQKGMEFGMPHHYINVFTNLLYISVNALEKGTKKKEPKTISLVAMIMHRCVLHDTQFTYTLTHSLVPFRNGSRHLYGMRSLVPRA